MTEEARVFVVHVPADLGVNIFAEAKAIGMMEEGYVWIATDAFADEWGSSSFDPSMEGVLGIKSFFNADPVIFGEFSFWLNETFKTTYPSESLKTLNLFSLLAYDAVWAVGMAVEDLFQSVGDGAKLNFIQKGEITVFEQGPLLLKSLVNMKFKGVSRAIEIEDAEIKEGSCNYTIVNVVEGKEKVIGYWTNNTELVNDLKNVSKDYHGKNSMEFLKDVTWPGRPTSIPRGWVMAAPGKRRLKLGVPIKEGFEQFVTVTKTQRNEQRVSGFCKDIFEEIVSMLDYSLDYDLVPIDLKGAPYHVLTLKVANKEIDGAIGDITIRSDRAELVDFTQPYSDTGFVMVVSIEGKMKSDAPFWDPFTTRLWILILIFILFVGMVIIIVEGWPTRTENGFWYSFSTVFFSQTHEIKKSLTRVLVLVWMTMILVVASTYEAILTSSLTVQYAKEAYDLESIRKYNYSVGYQQGSFIGDYLRNELNLSNLTEYSTTDEYGDGLNKGPQKGGVAAIFDELPYIQVFLSSHCNFTTFGPIYRSGGLAFVFPKGSPLVPDLSEGIQRLAEGRHMLNIENKWLNLSSCTPREVEIAGNPLSFSSYRKLFMVIGIIYLVLFVLSIFFLKWKDEISPTPPRNHE